MERNVSRIFFFVLQIAVGNMVKVNLLPETFHTFFSIKSLQVWRTLLYNQKMNPWNSPTGEQTEQYSKFRPICYTCTTRVLRSGTQYPTCSIFYWGGRTCLACWRKFGVVLQNSSTSTDVPRAVYVVHQKWLNTDKTSHGQKKIPFGSNRSRNMRWDQQLSLPSRILNLLSNACCMIPYFLSPFLPAILFSCLETLKEGVAGVRERKGFWLCLFRPVGLLRE